MRTKTTEITETPAAKVNARRETIKPLDDQRSLESLLILLALDGKRQGRKGN